MKKSIGILSLLVITAAFIFVGFKMVDMPSTYDGAAEIIGNETQEKTGAINSVTSIAPVSKTPPWNPPPGLKCP